MTEVGASDNLPGKRLDMRGVVDVLVGQIKREDLATVGVDANLQFAPSAALRGSMLLKTAIRPRRATSAPCCRRSGEGRPFPFAGGFEPAIRKPAG